MTSANGMSGKTVKVLGAIGYSCQIVLNNSKANGNMRKLMDSSLAKIFGWCPKVGIE